MSEKIKKKPRPLQAPIVDGLKISGHMAGITAETAFIPAMDSSHMDVANHAYRIARTRNAETFFSFNGHVFSVNRNDDGIPAYSLKKEGANAANMIPQYLENFQKFADTVASI